MPELSIPAGGPLFEGHFPGRPILPGIALLDLVMRAHGSRPTVVLCGIEKLRFRRVVLPGDRLEVDFANEEAGRIAFSVGCGNESVAAALVHPGDPRDVDFRPAPVAERRAAGRPADEGRAAVGLLPHRPPARFVTRIVSSSEDGVVCEALVPRGHPLAANGPAPALAAIEMAAQAAAVFEALRRADTEGEAAARPRLGYLVGARGVRFARATLAAESACVVSVRLDGVSGPFSSYDFEVSEADAPLARGQVGTWLTATDA